jgi:hypothetical protein
MMISHANREPIFASLESTEPEGRMLRIAKSQVVVLDREYLNFTRKGVEISPRNGGSQWSSLPRRPLAMWFFPNLAFGFPKQKVQFAGGGI